jgi:6-phosphogluconolactonase (cycloisomerase 2 family)
MMIDTWVLDLDGLATNHQVSASGAGGNFGFVVGRGNQLFVSEAAGGAANGSAVSSYQLSQSGDLSVVDSSVGTRQTAACWLVLTYDGSYTYTANAGSATISGFRVAPGGSLQLLTPSGITASTGAHPADMALSHDGQLLFSLNNGDGTLSAFAVQRDGGLHPIGSLSGLPTTSAGLAAW